MSCFHPLTAWKSRDPDDIGKKGKIKLVFKKELGYPNTEIQLACGQCAGCRLDKARAWAVRCCHEAQMHEHNCFLTLTYNNEHLPADNSLRPKDMQDFLKRLRKKHKIRYFQCGEYGDQFGRPHHHMLLFGYDFPDKLLIRQHKEHPLFASYELSKLWPHGHHSIGTLTFDSACYTARYILKKITGDQAEAHYGGRKPEYITMSRRPGIGLPFYNAYRYDIYNHDHCVIREGFITKPPRYYDSRFEIDNPDMFRVHKAHRKEAALNNLENNDERRYTKEKVLKIKQAQIPRPYEQNQSDIATAVNLTLPLS